jgi:methyl-accepting chemotaxis protein
VSCACGARFGLLTDDGCCGRTVSEIQRKIIKQNERNAVSRLFRAKSDKDAIAAWRLDLNRILHVFNVRFITLSPPVLIICFQTELAINTHVAVADVRHDVANTHNMVSDVHHSVASTHDTVSVTHDIVSGTRDIVSGTHNVVSDTRDIVSGTHNVVSDTHNMVSETHNAVSDIHRTIISERNARKISGIFVYFL